jgi:isopentenyl-diphosphate delta-isomerase
LSQESIHNDHLRKQSHLELAFASQNNNRDGRFYYEPMLSGHPNKEMEWKVKLGNQFMKYPIWISSMTGGSSEAGAINKMLAITAKKFGLGMGLGSCRIILENDTYFQDFNLRPILGEEIPLYANLGIAQIEQLLQTNRVHLIKKLVEKLNANGLIIHVNPLQEWLQPEGDRIENAPIETIQNLLSEIDIPLIVKEVGQGFGKESMKELLKLPLLAIDFAANGGTNFSKLELFRNPELKQYFEPIVNLGHSAEEMTVFINEVIIELGDKRKCDLAIISGGLRDFLDGYYLISKAAMPAIYGHAAAFLKLANESQEALDAYTQRQIEGLLFSKAFLKVKEDK